MAVFANLRKGSEEIKKAAQSGSGKKGGFMPTLRWKENEEKHYVLFLQSIDDIPTVLYHKMMDCGTLDNGNKMYRDFISRRDPNIDGPSGYDALDDLGYKPTNRNIAIACEMEPVLDSSGKIKSFVPMTRTFERKVEGGGKETVEEPAVSLIIEAPSVFFAPLTAYADEIGPIEDQVFLIRREGKDTNTSYTPIAVNKPFEFPEGIDDAIERLEAHVETLADADRMRELVESAPEGYVFNRFAKLKGKGGASAPAEEPASKPAPRAAKPAESKPKKRSRFDELKAELTGDK